MDKRLMCLVGFSSLYISPEPGALDTSTTLLLPRAAFVVIDYFVLLESHPSSFFLLLPSLPLLILLNASTCLSGSRTAQGYGNRGWDLGKCCCPTSELASQELCERREK